MAAMKRKCVLLTEAYARQTLPMAKGFAQLGWRVMTLSSSRLDLGNVTKYAAKRIRVERSVLETEAGFMAAIKEIMRTEKIDLIVPLSDFSAAVLARHKGRFAQETQIAVNDFPAFMKAYDKLQTMKICQANDIPCPLTLMHPKTIEEIETLRYPLVAKPRSGCGSIGFRMIKNREALESLLRTSENPWDTMLFQQFIPQTGKQYNVHMFLGKTHKVKTVIVAEKVRWFPLDGGASTLCKTVRHEAIAALCTKLLQKLQWVGYCDVDLICDPRDNIPKVIEINGRVSANVKLCAACDVNITKQIADCYADKPVTQYCGFPEDMRLRCIHTDLLWFLQSPMRFRTNPSWFSIRNTTDQIFSFTDLLPFFAFSVQSVRNYKAAMKKRER